MAREQVALTPLINPFDQWGFYVTAYLYSTIVFRIFSRNTETFRISTVSFSLWEI